jgi:hypothetical protein
VPTDDRISGTLNPRRRPATHARAKRPEVRVLLRRFYTTHLTLISHQRLASIPTCVAHEYSTEPWLHSSLTCPTLLV